MKSAVRVQYKLMLGKRKLKKDIYSQLYIVPFLAKEKEKQSKFTTLRLFSKCTNMNKNSIP